jgi:TonB family protein
MLGRLLLAGIATTGTLAAVDFGGNWVGMMVRGDQPSRISLVLNSRSRSVSGTVAFGDGDPIGIKHGRVFGDLLHFTVDDAAGNEVRFRLKAVDGLTIGQLVHKGEGLSGEALFGDDTADVELPFHNRCTTPPILLQSVQPEFSREARRARIEGAVFLSVRIDASGQPSEIHVVRGLGSGLDEKAVDALKKWQFQAAGRDGTPVGFETIVAMRFRVF